MQSSIWSSTARVFTFLAICAIGHPSCMLDAVAADSDRVASDPVDDLPSQAGSLDFMFMRLNLTIPSFAGMYVKKNGTVEVALVEPSDAKTARPAVEAFLKKYYPDLGNKDGFKIEFVRAKTKHDWIQILHYKAAMRDVLHIEQTAYLDADEVCGCVEVGITDERARSRVISFAKEAAVPSDSLRIVIAKAMPVVQDVTSQFRPMIGGIQIKNNAGPGAFFGFAGVCTLTIVADRVAVRGFVTASHCTRVQGGVEGTSFYQNGRTPFSLDYVGHETVDPVWTPGGPSCPMGGLCRMSDSAFVSLDIGSQEAQLALIARPTSLCIIGPCSLNLPTWTSALTVTSIGAPPMVGMMVTKVGRTTGWTGGPVSATCRDEFQRGTSFVVLCTTDVSMFDQGGDSGSPVFSIPPGAGASTASATLLGLLWGGDSTVPVASFSPISSALAEIGSLTLFPLAASGGGATFPTASCLTACKDARLACMKAGAGESTEDCTTDYAQCRKDCAIGNK